MAEADAMAIAAGTPGIVLMEAAGAAVASAARRMWAGGPVVVLAGPGNNGGDGWVAARLLRGAGYRVTVALLGDRQLIRGDAALAARAFEGVVVPATPTAFDGAGLVIDALFGAGVRLPLSTEAEALVEAANVSDARVLAVDLPSGVDGDSGAVEGAAIAADETVTFFRLKPGHLLLPGRLHCGKVSIADIGIGEGVLTAIAPKTFRNRPAMWLPDWPRAQPSGHKYDRGHTVVLSGGASATGAARLAAGAALRIGSGLVTIASPAAAAVVNAAQLTAVMLREADDPDALRVLLEDRRFNAVVVGPGLGVGEETARKAEVAMGGERTVVLDADGLTSFADEPGRLFKAIARHAKGGTILTPHDGEFARLFPDLAVGSRLARARAGAERTGAVLLLKGADTVVAAPDGRATIADNAPSTLATAGAGDVLSGIIAGLAAQGMPLFEAASAAVWVHGEAAAACGPGLTADDLPPAIPAVLECLQAG